MGDRFNNAFAGAMIAAARTQCGIGKEAGAGTDILKVLFGGMKGGAGMFMDDAAKFIKPAAKSAVAEPTAKMGLSRVLKRPAAGASDFLPGFENMAGNTAKPGSLKPMLQSALETAKKNPKMTGALEVGGTAAAGYGAGGLASSLTGLANPGVAPSTGAIKPEEQTAYNAAHKGEKPFDWSKAVVPGAGLAAVAALAFLAVNASTDKLNVGDGK